MFSKAITKQFWNFNPYADQIYIGIGIELVYSVHVNPIAHIPDKSIKGWLALTVPENNLKIHHVVTV